MSQNKQIPNMNSNFPKCNAQLFPPIEILTCGDDEEEEGGYDDGEEDGVTGLEGVCEFIAGRSLRYRSIMERAGRAQRCNIVSTMK